MDSKGMLIIAFLIVGILSALFISTAASNYSESETTKIALKEGYCSKVVKKYILWEKCR